MKLVGSGSPRTLTVRVQPCEIALWREMLRQRLVDETQAADPDSSTGALGVIARLLERAHAPVAPGQPWVMVGPTPVLGQVICAVADAANKRYSGEQRRFDSAPDVTNAERLRVALDATSACLATVFALARVQSDAIVV